MFRRTFGPGSESFFGTKFPGNETSPLDVDVVELRVQADASMPTSNNNVNSHYIL